MARESATWNPNLCLAQYVQITGQNKQKQTKRVLFCEVGNHGVNGEWHCRQSKKVHSVCKNANEHWRINSSFADYR